MKDGDEKYQEEEEDKSIKMKRTSVLEGGGDEKNQEKENKSIGDEKYQEEEGNIIGRL